MNKVSSARAIELNCQHKRLYSEAYSFLAAEAAAAEAYEGEPLEHDELQRVGEMIRDILNGEMHRSAKGEGRMLRRFISAVGANGKVLLQDTVNKLCKQNYFFENPLHAHQILSSAADTAVELGLDAILCPEPLRPERLEALLLPELGLAFSAAYGDDEGRGLNISFGRARPERQTGQDEAMIRAKLRHEATKRLSRAKAVHDELEGLHRPQMDFAALTEFTGKYIKDIFN